MKIITEFAIIVLFSRNEPFCQKLFRFVDRANRILLIEYFTWVSVDKQKCHVTRVSQDKKVSCYMGLGENKSILHMFTRKRTHAWGQTKTNAVRNQLTQKGKNRNIIINFLSFLQCRI